MLNSFLPQAVVVRAHRAAAKEGERSAVAGHVEEDVQPELSAARGDAPERLRRAEQRAVVFRRGDRARRLGEEPDCGPAAVDGSGDPVTTFQLYLHVLNGGTTYETLTVDDTAAGALVV